MKEENRNNRAAHDEPEKRQPNNGRECFNFTLGVQRGKTLGKARWRRVLMEEHWRPWPDRRIRRRRLGPNSREGNSDCMSRHPYKLLSRKGRRS